MIEAPLKHGGSYFIGGDAFRTDFGIAFGGFKQSGQGREGGIRGLRPYLEVTA